MDPGAKRFLWNIIRKARDLGMTVLLSSHRLVVVYLDIFYQFSNYFKFYFKVWKKVKHYVIKWA